MTTIFIDNGVTGTIGVIYSDGKSEFMLTPTVKMQDYTKAKKNVTRIDTPRLMDIMSDVVCHKNENSFMAYIERPMVNPTRWSASMSAIRALEATITILETLKVPYQFVDSKEWQRGLLPSSGKKGVESSVLKQESHDIGIRLFPMHKELINKHKDADGILGAYAFHSR